MGNLYQAMKGNKEIWKETLDLEAPMTLEEKQLEIINHYGTDWQLEMLTEECSELIQAICKYKRFKKLANIEIDYTTNIAQEIADVENIIEQLKLKIKDLAEDVEDVKEFKVDRELKRIYEYEEGEE